MKKELNEEELEANPSIVMMFRRVKYEDLMKDVENYANEGKTYEEVNRLFFEEGNPNNKKVICSQDIYDYYVEHGLIQEEKNKKEDEETQEELVKQTFNILHIADTSLRKLIFFLEKQPNKTIEDTMKNVCKKAGLDISASQLGSKINLFEDELKKDNVFITRKRVYPNVFIKIQKLPTNEANKLRFLDIVNKCKGNRTYKEYSKELQVDEGHLWRLMNDKLKSRPTMEILKKIAENSKGITTYGELLKFCGYIKEDEYKDLNNSNVMEEIKRIEDSELFKNLQQENKELQQEITELKKDNEDLKHSWNKTLDNAERLCDIAKDYKAEIEELKGEKLELKKEVDRLDKKIESEKVKYTSLIKKKEESIKLRKKEKIGLIISQIIIKLKKETNLKDISLGLQTINNYFEDYYNEGEEEYPPILTLDLEIIFDNLLNVESNDLKEEFDRGKSINILKKLIEKNEKGIKGRKNEKDEMRSRMFDVFGGRYPRGRQ